MTALLLDLRAALRGLLRDRAFTVFSVLALALGLGLNGSLLVLSRTLLLRPVPVAHPETLLEVVDDTHDGSKDDRLGSTTAYAAVRELPEFEAVAEAPSRTYTVRWRTGEGLQDVLVMDASWEYLPLIGVRPFLGRIFLPEESGLMGDGKVALVSHRFWKQAMGGRGDVLGRTLTLDGQLRTVVGVLPPGFEGHQRHLGLDVLVSSKTKALPALQGGRLMTGVLARLRPGVPLSHAQARLASLPWSKDFKLALQPYRPLPKVLGARLTKGLGILHGAGLLILGIAVCNVLALQSARLQRRHPELALRVAMGARGGHLFRLLLLENAVLALLAGVVALVLAAFSTPFLEALQAVLPYPPKLHVALGLWSSVSTLLAALGLGGLLALFGLVQARRLDLGRALQHAGTRTSALRARGVFVAVQGALSLVLLCTAALSLRDLRRQLDIPLGFLLQDRFQISCNPRGANRPRIDLERVTGLLRERVAALPGVRMTALSVGGAPMVQGMRIRENGGRVLLCTHELPSLLGLSAASGRDLDRSDEDSGRALVDDAMAHTLWAGQPVLGSHTGPSERPLHVVGVVGSTRMAGPTRPPTPLLIVPVSKQEVMYHQPFDTLTLHVPGSPKAVVNAIRATAREVMGDLPFTFDSLAALRDEELAQPRRLLFLSSVLGALALVLSLTGLYGLAAHLAEARLRELGLRVALGAGPCSILATLAKASLMPLLPGLAAGAMLAFAASRLLATQNPGLQTLDATLLLWTSLSLSLAAALAALLPALRAARVHPAEALRSDS